MPPKSTLSILAILQDFVANHREEHIPVRALVAHLAEHGLLLLLLVFALFCAIPLPIPGIHIILSLPLFYVTIQQTLGYRRILLPQKILDQTLPRAGFVGLIDHAAPWFHRLETYIHPRLTFVTDGVWYQVMGAISFFITCVIIIPLPLTNMVPAIAICLIALGMLCHDGLVTIIGALIGLSWCLAWLGLAALIGIEGFTHIYAFIFG